VKSRGALLAAVVALVLVAAADGAQGTLDANFGTGGLVLTDFGGLDIANAVATAKDGRIVLAGETEVGGNISFALARYTRDGSLDSSFGSGGKVTTDLGAVEFANAVALAPKGRIVAAGHTSAGGGDMLLVRYLSNGSLDPSFGIGGVVETDLGGGETIKAISVQTNGKIIAVGASTSGGNTDFVVARYMSNGALDPHFGFGGVVTTEFGGLDDIASAVAVQKDGKIVAAGASDAGGTVEFALARYNSHGVLTPGFGTGGLVTTSFGPGSIDVGFGVAIQDDGKIVVGGGHLAGGTVDFAAARYRPDGSLDPTFGTGGLVTTAFPGVSFATAVGIRGDDITLVGSIGLDPDFAAAQYRMNGNLESTFGSGGTVTTDFSGAGSLDAATAMAFQSRTQIVVAGFSNAGGTFDFALLRYLAR
jgi:uncharacterized delta-60 repeat protein